MHDSATAAGLMAARLTLPHGVHGCAGERIRPASLHKDLNLIDARIRIETMVCTWLCESDWRELPHICHFPQNELAAHDR
jgi:hypothetical protein